MCGDVFDLKPAGIINTLDLLRPPFIKKTSAYGHFGRNDPDFTWEITDKAEEIRAKSAIISKNIMTGCITIHILPTAVT